MSPRSVAVFGLFVVLNGCGRGPVVAASQQTKERDSSVSDRAVAARSVDTMTPGTAGTGTALRADSPVSTTKAAPAARSAAAWSWPRRGVIEPSLPAGWRYQASEVTARNGMVVTDNSIATTVGRDVLATGGSAVDAAVAVAFALAVTYPTAGNLGGGGFAVTMTNGTARALDFRETAPLAAHRDMYLGPDGKPSKDSHEGIRSVGVPGTVAGLWELHRKLGSKQKTWSELVAPAITLAEEGFVVDEDLASGLAQVLDRLSKSPESKKLFLPGGRPLARGSTWKNPDLGRVLRRIAKEGADGFYRGPTARALVEQMERDHGLIVQADLDRYAPKWREPLSFTYRGARFVTMPPPSSGGISLAMICHILEGYDLASWGFQSPAALHLTFEAMRRSFAARNARLGDPDFVAVPLEELLGTTWANAQRATIRHDRATPSSEVVSAGAATGTGPHTTHFSVVDGEGNAVALTTTINWWYGSGVTVRGAGFVLNNEMDDFATVPGKPNAYGLVQGEANAIAPGKRMLSSMSPTIVTDPDGKVVMVAGAAGGPTIITAVFQQVSNVLDFGASFGVAVAAPRFHMQHLPDSVTFERGGLPDASRMHLETFGHRFVERGHVADAPFIGRRDDVWVGVAEPRRKGALAAGP